MNNPDHPSSLCPYSEDIARLALGELPEKQLDSVRVHLDECRECREFYYEICELIQETSILFPQLPHVPESLSANKVALLKQEIQDQLEMIQVPQGSPVLPSTSSVSTLMHWFQRRWHQLAWGMVGILAGWILVYFIWNPFHSHSPIFTHPISEEIFSSASTSSQGVPSSNLQLQPEKGNSSLSPFSPHSSDPSHPTELSHGSTDPTSKQEVFLPPSTTLEEPKKETISATTSEAISNSSPFSQKTSPPQSPSSFPTSPLTSKEITAQTASSETTVRPFSLPQSTLPQEEEKKLGNYVRVDRMIPRVPWITVDEPTKRTVSSVVIRTNFNKIQVSPNPSTLPHKTAIEGTPVSAKRLGEDTNRPAPVQIIQANHLFSSSVIVDEKTYRKFQHVLPFLQKFFDNDCLSHLELYPSFRRIRMLGSVDDIIKIHQFINLLNNPQLDWIPISWIPSEYSLTEDEKKKYTALQTGCEDKGSATIQKKLSGIKLNRFRASNEPISVTIQRLERLSKNENFILLGIEPETRISCYFDNISLWESLESLAHALHCSLIPSSKGIGLIPSDPSPQTIHLAAYQVRDDMRETLLQHLSSLFKPEYFHLIPLGEEREKISILIVQGRIETFKSLAELLHKKRILVSSTPPTLPEEDKKEKKKESSAK